MRSKMNGQWGLVVMTPLTATTSIQSLIILMMACNESVSNVCLYVDVDRSWIHVT